MKENDSKKTNIGTDFVFGREIFKVLREQPDATGVGSHFPAEHHGHGLHGQLNVGIRDRTVNIRIRPPFHEQ